MTLYGALPLKRATRGPVVVVRTARVVWQTLNLTKRTVFLWKVFLFHEPNENRCHTRPEREACSIYSLWSAHGSETQMSLAVVSGRRKRLLLGRCVDKGCVPLRTADHAEPTWTWPAGRLSHRTSEASMLLLKSLSSPCRTNRLGGPSDCYALSSNAWLKTAWSAAQAMAPARPMHPQRWNRVPTLRGSIPASPGRSRDLGVRPLDLATARADGQADAGGLQHVRNSDERCAQATAPPNARVPIH